MKSVTFFGSSLDHSSPCMPHDHSSCRRRGNNTQHTVIQESSTPIPSPPISAIIVSSRAPAAGSVVRILRVIVVSISISIAISIAVIAIIVVIIPAPTITIILSGPIIRTVPTVSPVVPVITVTVTVAVSISARGRWRAVRGKEKSQACKTRTGNLDSKHQECVMLVCA